MAKFKVGDRVMVPEGTPGARWWWGGKPAIIRTVFEDMDMYELLFLDAQDYAFVQGPMLVSAGESDPEFVTELHNMAI